MDIFYRLFIFLSVFLLCANIVSAADGDTITVTSQIPAHGYGLSENDDDVILGIVRK